MPSPFASTICRYRGGLQTMPWLSLLGYSVLIVLYGTVLGLFLPASWQRPYARALMMAPLLLLMAKDLAGFPLCVARVQAAVARDDTWLRRLAATLPPEWMGFLRLERAMWYGFFNWLLRRPHPVRPSGIPLGYMERGGYSTVICCALLVLFVEMPLDVFIASVMAKTPDQARTLHVAFGVIAAYSFVWVLGDRWHVVNRRHHLLTGTSLELDIGARGFGTIPLDAIASCVRLNESRAAWCRRHGHSLHATRKLTPFDAPNLVLLLKPGCDVRLTLLQLERGGDSPIFVYLDRPELLCLVTSPA